MLRIFTFLSLLLSSALASDKIQTILITTPVLHTLNDGDVLMAKIPYTGWDIDNPYLSCFYYSLPNIVFEDTAHLKQDVNLISAYKITVDSNHRGGIATITIRTGKAEKPEKGRLSIAQVVELTIKAVREDFPDEKRYLINESDKPFKPAESQ